MKRPLILLDGLDRDPVPLDIPVDRMSFAVSIAGLPFLELLRTSMERSELDNWGREFLEQEQALDRNHNQSRSDHELEEVINRRIGEKINKINSACALADVRRQQPVLAVLGGDNPSLTSLALREQAKFFGIPVLSGSALDHDLGETLQKLLEEFAAKKSLHILEIVHDFPPNSYSGTELYTLNLAGELQRRGHRVTILYPVVDEQQPLGFLMPTIFQGLDVLRFNNQHQKRTPFSSWSNPDTDPLFEHILERSDFDLVHVQHLMGFSHTWLQVIKNKNIPLVMKHDDMFFYCERFHLNRPNGTYCAGGPESLDKCATCTRPQLDQATPEVQAAEFQHMALRRAHLRRAFTRPDHIHVPSRFLKENFARFGFYNKRVEVLQTGIVPFAVTARKPDPKGRLHLAYLGSVHERKGIDDFVRAAVTLLESLDPQSRERVRFHVHGKMTGDPSCKRLEQAVAQWPELVYEGAFTPVDRPRILSSIDCLVMPSIGENFPFLLREALYAGVPVVATQIAGVPEIVEDGKNGFLYPPGDVQQLATLFRRFLETPSLLTNLDTGFRRFSLVAEETERLESIFHELVDTFKPIAEEDLLERNLAALRRSNPAIADWIAPIKDSDLYADYEVTSRRALRQGRAIHDLDDPEGEAGRLAENWLQTTPSGPVRVMGFGLGLHLEALLERMAPDRPLQVQLLDRVVFQLVLRRRDLASLLGDPRLRFVADLLPDTAHVLPGYTV